MKIALDIMGGDHAPLSNIKGAFSYLEEYSNDGVEIILVGDKQEINKIISEYSYNIGKFSIIHTTQVVNMKDKPTRVIRTKPDSSLVKCIELIKTGQADAALSAGHTGALLATSLLMLGKIKGIRRPALAPYIPTKHGGIILCDAGANSDVKPQHLLQFAIMASAYLEHLENIENPKVGLLNIGNEENKGNELVQQAYPILSQYLDNFIGNIEARYLMDGNVDVVVCDGFTGNIVLKQFEGIFEHLMNWLNDSLNNNLKDPEEFFPVIQDIINKLDYEEHGGTPLLGINGIVMKCHGSSTSKSIKNTIKAIKKFHNENLINDIAERLSNHLEIFDDTPIVSESQTT